MEDNTPFHYDIGTDGDIDECFVKGAPEIEDIRLIVEMQTCLGVTFHGKPYYLCRRERALSEVGAIDYPYMNVPKPDDVDVVWMDLYTENHRRGLELEFVQNAGE